ncbi:DUF2514 family protein [Delftia sp. S67]|nr:DUF2514 family protein [Delftia sp. S65]MBK0121797.1 DUF2514 family protein [Delftia sp. S67]MBK0133370.1 DUF2514 family protein [Delftia sp. S66]
MISALDLAGRPALPKPVTFLVHRCRPSHAAACSDKCALTLFAELQRRAVERAGSLATVSDEARGRGQACEPAYDAAFVLTKATKSER